MNVTKAAFLLIFTFLTGCMRPMYETDFPLYQQYKYWESADADWQEADYFRVRVLRIQDGDISSLRLIAHRDGMPTTADGYIKATQKVAFNMMSAACGRGFVSPLRAKAPEKGRVIDKFFYQYKDTSVGVSYFCRPNGKPRGLDLAAEQQKWSLAHRSWDEINGHKAFVDMLPVSADKRQEFRIRLFGGTVSDNYKLARRIISDTCPNTNFRLLSEKAGYDIVPTGHPPEIISEDNVRIYEFTCTP